MGLIISPLLSGVPFIAVHLFGKEMPQTEPCTVVRFLRSRCSLGIPMMQFYCYAAFYGIINNLHFLQNCA